MRTSLTRAVCSLPAGLREQPRRQGAASGRHDGFNDVQRFYIGYGSVWSQNIRPEEVLRLTKLDPHSLGEWRVNATLRNIDDFYKAFDIKEGDKMYLAPENRVNVW